MEVNKFKSLNPAFTQWLKQHSEGNIQIAAATMLQMLTSSSSPDNFIWDLLQLTGHEKYSDKTFLVVAGELLSPDESE